VTALLIVAGVMLAALGVEFGATKLFPTEVGFVGTIAIV